MIPCMRGRAWRLIGTTIQNTEDLVCFGSVTCVGKVVGNYLGFKLPCHRTVELELVAGSRLCSSLLGHIFSMKTFGSFH